VSIKLPTKLHEINDDDVKRAYARWAPVYDFTFGKVADNGRLAAVEHINKSTGNVLEVGVGTGISLPHYKDHLAVTGVDLSPDMLEIARKRVKKHNLANVTAIREMDAANMTFADNSFQTVVAMYVLTVVPDPVKVMHELARICAPGGEVIIINHFSQNHGLRGMVEKAMSGFGNKLGWRPEFPISTLMVSQDLQLLDTTPLKPFGLFTLMRFQKQQQRQMQPGTSDKNADSQQVA